LNWDAWFVEVDDPGANMSLPSGLVEISEAMSDDDVVIALIWDDVVREIVR
jgi:hypothetical protein